MFTSGQLAIDVPPGIARSRLASLIRDGWLSEASAEVYQQNAADLLRVGPFGEARGTSRLVRARFTVPSYRDDGMRVGMRWEAIGVTGGLFPALDADISLTAEAEAEAEGEGEREGEGEAGDERGTLVALTGTYRPPLGLLGAGLDRLVLRKVAAATVAAFLNQLGAALATNAANAVNTVNTVNTTATVAQ